MFSVLPNAISDAVRVERARICLCVLCGLPAAGKSTLTRILPDHFRKRGWGYFILSYDEVIPEEAYELRKYEDDAAVDTQSSWKLYRQEVLLCLDEFLRTGDAPLRVTGLSGGQRDTLARFARLVQNQQVFMTQDSLPEITARPLIFLLDDNFYYRSMRYEVYQLARKHSVGFCQLYLQCPVDFCLTRNQGRSCPLPDDVIVDMATRIQPPNPLKNPWEQNSVTLTSTEAFSQDDIEMMMTLFVAALDNPLVPIQDNTEQKEADRQHCASSIVHQADQACRRLVSQAMQKARGCGTQSHYPGQAPLSGFQSRMDVKQNEHKLSPDTMRILAADLNQLKTRFLDDLRKHMLQGSSTCPGETMDLDQVVRTAVAVFDRQKDELIGRCITEHEVKSL